MSTNEEAQISFAFFFRRPETWSLGLSCKFNLCLWYYKPGPNWTLFTPCISGRHHAGNSCQGTKATRRNSEKSFGLTEHHRTPSMRNLIRRWHLKNGDVEENRKISKGTKRDSGTRHEQRENCSSRLAKCGRKRASRRME